MEPNKTGALIAAVRGERGLTQRELAAKLHISATTVSKWERGAGFPDVSLLEPLAAALDLTLPELFQGERAEEGPAPDVDALLADAVRLSRLEARRRYARTLAIALCAALVPILIVIWQSWPLNAPATLLGTYQSGFHGSYYVQFAVTDEKHHGENTFVEYIDSREVDRGTWTAHENGAYHLAGARQDLWIVLDDEDRFWVSIPGIEDGAPIWLENLWKTPAYNGYIYGDEGAYQALLQKP